MAYLVACFKSRGSENALNTPKKTTDWPTDQPTDRLTNWPTDRPTDRPKCFFYSHREPASLRSESSMAVCVLPTNIEVTPSAFRNTASVQRLSQDYPTIIPNRITHTIFLIFTSNRISVKNATRWWNRHWPIVVCFEAIPIQRRLYWISKGKTVSRGFVLAIRWVCYSWHSNLAKSTVKYAWL